MELLFEQRLPKWRLIRIQLVNYSPCLRKPIQVSMGQYEKGFYWRSGRWMHSSSISSTYFHLLVVLDYLICFSWYYVWYHTLAWNTYPQRMLRHMHIQSLTIAGWYHIIDSLKLSLKVLSHMLLQHKVHTRQLQCRESPKTK